MLKPINNVANRVTDGRRYASRSIVISKLSAIACFVFRRQVISAVEGEAREESIWEGGMVLSSNEEHATEYVEQGHAMMVFDSFTGGSIHTDGDDINIGEAFVYAQIEPIFIEHYPNKSEMLRNTPNWKPKKGDVFGLVISETLIKWLECVGVTGQSIHANHGERYALNVRDSLMHLDLFKDYKDTLLPKINNFPIKLHNLVYSDQPIYELGETTTEKAIKLVSFTDPEISELASVKPIKQMASKTNSPYFLSEADQAKITVNIGTGEHFILESNGAVKGIEIGQGVFSNMLFMIDNIAVVKKISDDLSAFKSVVVEQDGKEVFKVLSTHFNQDKKAFHFVLFVQLGVISNYTLKFEDGTAYSLFIDAENVKIAQ